MKSDCTCTAINYVIIYLNIESIRYILKSKTKTNTKKIHRSWWMCCSSRPRVVKTFIYCKASLEAITVIADRRSLCTRLPFAVLLFCYYCYFECINCIEPYTTLLKRMRFEEWIKLYAATLFTFIPMSNAKNNNKMNKISWSPCKQQHIKALN